MREIIPELLIDFHRILFSVLITLVEPFYFVFRFPSLNELLKIICPCMLLHMSRAKLANHLFEQTL
jgi:hypothetical protein